METINIKIRSTAAELLAVLSSRNKSMCEELEVEISSFVALAFAKPYGSYPTDYLLNILTILNNLAKYHTMKTYVCNDKFAQALVYAITVRY